jgi:hypothetical protein
MLTTSQYQHRLSSITNVAPVRSANHITVFNIKLNYLMISEDNFQYYDAISSSAVPETMIQKKISLDVTSLITFSLSDVTMHFRKKYPQFLK